MRYKVDLHIHSVLSPCGDLEMSPRDIVLRAKEKGLDLIAVTDHNTMRHCRLTRRIGMENGVGVIFGCEVTSKEEIHCLAYFDDESSMDDFQAYLDANLPNIENDPDKFGYQVEVDYDLNIVYEEPKLLISAIGKSVDEISKRVRSLGGIFALAHIDKQKNSVLSQLGFVPFDLEYDFLELSSKCDKDSFIAKNKYLKDKIFIVDSDSHYIDQIGTGGSELDLISPDFEGLKKYLDDVKK